MSDSDSTPSPQPGPAPFPEDNEVIRLVTEETASARTKHNFSIERSSIERCLRILVEEVGEASGAIEDLDVAWNGPFDDAGLHAAEQHLLDEIVQVASVAMRWASARIRTMTRANIPDPYVPPKKFFTFKIGGCTYWVVARDAGHAIEVLDGFGSEFGDPSVPFADAKDEDGDPLALVEMTPEQAASIYVFDVSPERVRTPLTECDIGASFSTET